MDTHGDVDRSAGHARSRRVIVIGAGAAGTMAAIFAARAGASTLLIERTRDGGRKILISGGGRCNLLPAHVDESRFVTDSSPNLLRKMLRAWPLREQRAFFEELLGGPLVEETETAKLFPPTQRARDVRDALLREARNSGVTMRMETRVVDVVAEGSDAARKWRVDIDGGVPLYADAVIIATGGLSVPNTGSDGTGLRLLAALGHEMHPTYAALTPVTSGDAPFNALSGISLEVALRARSRAATASARGGFLFTHHGYSGPSVLDVSHVLVRARASNAASDTQLTVQWSSLDAEAWERALEPHGQRTVTGALRAHLPDRLVALLLDVANVDPTRQLAELRREERRRLITTLVACPLPWIGDEGYRKAEVTGGGVALSEVHPRTLESRRHPGLYLCGEVLDAFGPIGGYNFLWAWATGRSAGMAAGASAPAQDEQYA